MLGWFAETTIVAAVLAVVAVLAGRLRPIGPDGPARALAGGPDQADHSALGLVALGRPWRDLAWPIISARGRVRLADVTRRRPISREALPRLSRVADRSAKSTGRSSG